MEPGESRDHPPSPGSDEAAAARQLSVQPDVRKRRAFWRSIPSAPRCKLCTSPFGGPAGAALRLLGKGPWPANPRYCRGCFVGLEIKRELLIGEVALSIAVLFAVGAIREPV